MIKTILFDLDGTILNTNELIIASFLHALEGLTPEPYTREHIIAHFGSPLVEQLQMYTGLNDVEDVITKYRDFNIGRHDELVSEFPRVKEVLAELKRNGISMGVVTSKIRRTTLMGLQRFGLDAYMDIVVTVDDVQEAKPSPQGIRMAMAALGGESKTTLMVGDSQYDILAAKNAGVRSAAVAWSMKGESYLREYCPDYVLSDMHELLPLVGIKEG